MKPVHFKGENFTFTAPENMKEECGDLPCWVGKSEGGLNLVISCWELSEEELKEVQDTGRIFLTVVGTGMPPVSLGVANKESER